MKYKEFENNLSQKLNAEEINVDTGSLIEAIHKGSKNKSYNYYFGFFSLIALGLISAWAFNFNSVNDKGIKNDLHSNSLNINKITDDKNSFLHQNISGKLLDNNDKNLSEENQEFVNENNVNEKALSSTNAVQENKNQQSRHESEANNQQINIKNFPNKKYTNKSSNVTYLKTPNNKLYPKPIEEESTSFIERASSETVKLGQQSTIIKDDTELKRSLINVPTISNLNNELNYERALAYEAVECPDFLTGGVKVSYNIEAGIFFADKALIEKEEENEEMYLLRKDKEKTLESLNIASSAIIKKENGPFYITAGVSYTRIAEQMRLNHNWTEYDTSIGIISTTTSQTGDTITVVMGEIIKEINYQRNSVDHYYIHLVDLPFGLGLENHRGNFIYGIDGGVQLNLYTHSTGRFYRNVASYTELPNENVFRTAIGISYYGSMRMGLKLNYNSSVYLAAKVRFIPGDFAANNNNISQYYTLYGINAGYRYSF